MNLLTNAMSLLTMLFALVLLATLLTLGYYFISTFLTLIVSCNNKVKFLKAHYQFNHIRMVTYFNYSRWGVSTIDGKYYIIRIPINFVENWAAGLEADEIYFYKIEEESEIDLLKLKEEFKIDNYFILKWVTKQIKRNNHTGRLTETDSIEECTRLLSNTLRKNIIEKFMEDYIKL